MEVSKVDRESQEEKTIDSVDLDLSQLLFVAENDKSITFEFDKWKAMELLYLNITVSTDLPLLNRFLRKKLNPLLVNLISCKDIPYNLDPNYKPIYSIFRFVDGRNFRTRGFP